MLGTLAVAMVALFGGCSNPVLVNYSGVRCPPVNTAHVSVAAPTNATLLGTSDFVTSVVPGNTEIIRAAERVGADIVQWDRAYLRQDVTLLRQSLVGDGVAPSGTGELAVEQSGEWYRVHARFWRSNALGGFPPTPAPAPAPTQAPTEAPGETPAAAPSDAL